MDLTHLPPAIAQRLEFITNTLSLADPKTDDLGRAAAACEDLLTADRTNSGIIFLLGTVYMKVGKFGIAENLFQRAIQLSPDAPEVYNNLGFICHSEGRVEEATVAFNRCLELQPDNVEAMSNLASVFVNNGTPQRALDACDQVLAADPTQVDAKWNRALALLEMGRWDEAWPAYRAGLDLGGRSSLHRKARHTSLPYWDGDPSVPVVVYGEQGVGDELMGYSMIPDLLDAGVDFVLEAHPRLVNIAREAFHGVPVYGTRKLDDDGAMVFAEHPHLRAKIPILGLGEYFRSTDASFPRVPYLDHMERLTDLLPPLAQRLHVGLSWSGGTQPTRGDLRSIALGAFLPMMEHFGDQVQWISLQYDPAEAPGLHGPVVAQFSKDTKVPVHHWPHIINDLDLCYAGLLPQLDLVVSVNTSLVHACGAFGVRCVTLTPSKPAWRYGMKGIRMPWYGNHVRVARQETEGDWSAPLQVAFEAITTRLGSKAA